MIPLLNSGASTFQRKWLCTRTLIAIKRADTHLWVSVVCPHVRRREVRLRLTLVYCLDQLIPVNCSPDIFSAASLSPLPFVASFIFAFSLALLYVRHPQVLAFIPSHHNAKQLSTLCLSLCWKYLSLLHKLNVFLTSCSLYVHSLNLLYLKEEPINSWWAHWLWSSNPVQLWPYGIVYYALQS